MKVLWLQGVTCNGNTHSFLNAPGLSVLLEKLTFMHHPVLPCELELAEVASCQHDCDVLIVEGAVDTTMRRAGRKIAEIIAHYAASARYVIAAGSCAAFGGVFKATAPERITGVGYDGMHPINDGLDHLINLPGCPLHPTWFGIVLEMILAGKPIRRDRLQRPVELYAHLVHHGCAQ